MLRRTICGFADSAFRKTCDNLSLVVIISTVLLCFLGMSSVATAQQAKKKAAVVKRDTNVAEHWIVRNIDEMEGDTSFYSKEFLDLANTNKQQKLQVFLYCKVSQDYYSTSIYPFGAGSCVDEGARLIFLFTDGTKLDVEGINDFNCENRIIYQLSDEDLTMFLEKAVSKVRAYTYDGYVEESVKPDQAKEWRTTLRHLVALRRK